MIPPLRVGVYHALDDLPGHYQPLFEDAARRGFYGSRAWWSTLLDGILDAGDTVALYGVETEPGADGAEKATRALALWPMRAPAPTRRGPLGERRLANLCNFYTTLYEPTLAAGADVAAVARAFAAALARDRPRWSRLWFRALPREGALFAALADALAASGFVVERHFDFGNWFEVLDSVDADRYLAARPATLRNTLVRKERKLARAARVDHDVIADPDAAERGIALYERVYRHSWKEPEPYPRFMPTLIRRAATAGALRLGVLSIAGEPAAAQVWLVGGGNATIFKLAYDERFGEFSVGSLLTWWMMRRMIESGHVREVDFGRGDDPYKRDWLGERRERWGLLCHQPRTVAGLARIGRTIAARHAGRVLRRRRGAV